MLRSTPKDYGFCSDPSRARLFMEPAAFMLTATFHQQCKNTRILKSKPKRTNKQSKTKNPLNSYSVAKAGIHAQSKTVHGTVFQGWLAHLKLVGTPETWLNSGNVVVKAGKTYPVKTHQTATCQYQNRLTNTQSETTSKVMENGSHCQF